ncbi:MAG TPA: DsbA family protein [Myxococcota bacterium]|nr:DsbA family protein [Myxococcota bacterium]
MPIAHLVVYSDYLCPWCYNAAVRLRRIREEFAPSVRLEWRSFLLRPRPTPGRDLERFRSYTESWLRPAAEADAGTFQIWRGDAGPPTHSVPPHLVAKAAALLGAESFERIHEALLRAYFGESRDITQEATLRALWEEAGLAPEGLARADDPEILRSVLGQHDEAIELGVTGVPTVVLEGNGALVMGAQPLDIYRRWIRRVIGA